MKRILQILFCVLFFGTCLFFSLGMMIPGASEAAEGDVTMPSLMKDGSPNEDFADEFEDYFTKSFAYRSYVVDAYASLKVGLFGEGNDQVIVGRDDFLFFAETLDDYVGKNKMTDDEINAAADSLLAFYEYARARGTGFLFLCAPNKNHVYGEYMPARYVADDQPTDLDRLYAALDERGVPYADLRTPLADGKAEALLYHKRDTHWNGQGARVAYETTADALGFPSLDFDSLTAVESDTFEGDLDTLLFPGRTMYDDDSTYDFDGLFVYTSAYSTPMDMQITTRGGGSGKLLMFRDSFANALIPLFASSFAECRFERAIPFRADLLESYSADYMIIEIAERNIHNLIGADERIK